MLFLVIFFILVKDFFDKNMKEFYEINFMDEFILCGIIQYYVYVEEK